MARKGARTGGKAHRFGARRLRPQDPDFQLALVELPRTRQPRTGLPRGEIRRRGGDQILDPRLQGGRVGFDGQQIIGTVFQYQFARGLVLVHQQSSYVT